MPNLRARGLRQINRLLDQCEEAIAKRDWGAARDLANSVLRMDSENRDALAYLSASDTPAVVTSSPTGSATDSPTRGEQLRASDDNSAATSTGAKDLPSAFVSGRYQVQRFLGEGGKKRVYLTHDSQLDRDVAFALLKSDGLDPEGLARIRREAQAMGRLGDHPHIVTVFDIGDEQRQPYIVSQYMAGGDLAGLIARADDHRIPSTRL